MTYTGVHLLLEGDPGMRERYAPLVERFELMRELAEILTRKRYKRGSIDFDLPEPLIEFDASGEMTGMTRSPRNIAHRIIEEFMLAANEAVAAHLEQTGLPAIYRTHDQPDPKRVMEFEEVAAQFGYSLGMGAIPVTKHRYQRGSRRVGKVYREVVLPEAMPLSSKAYQRLVAKIEGKPEERILSYLMLRSLKQARYSEENTGHFALAATHYTHFTSPIRRYPDLMVHRLLEASLEHQDLFERGGDEGDCGGLFGDGAAGGGCGAGTGGVEEGEVHGEPGGRGVRWADYQHGAVRGVSWNWRICLWRGWCRSICCRGIGIRITRMCGRLWGSGRGGSFRSGIGAGDAGPGGSAGAEAAVCDCGAGGGEGEEAEVGAGVRWRLERRFLARQWEVYKTSQVGLVREFSRYKTNPRQVRGCGGAADEHSRIGGGAVSARCLFTKRTRRGLADRSGNREALALQNEPIAAVPKPLYKTNSGGVSRRAHGRPINDSGSNLVREFSRYKTAAPGCGFMVMGRR